VAADEHSGAADRSPAAISLCLIVRNAEATLGAALLSARPFMDELVVVDTGSTDRSREIARQHGAKVIEFAWCDSFAAARNFSIEQAAGDWIFWMDADDVLPPASGERLRQVVAEHPERDAAFWVMVEEQSEARGGRQRVMGHAHVKLFPRRNDLRFCYRVHEQISPAIRAAGLPILQSGAVVRHVTDRSPAAQAARRERNLRLALQDLAERPDDPFVFYSLGTAYVFLPEGLPTAIDYLKRCVAGCKRGAEMQLNSYLFLGQAYGMSGERQIEEQVYREALTLFANDATLLRRLADLASGAGRLEEAVRWYETLLKSGRVRPSAVHVRGGQAEAALRLGQLHLRRGQPEQARRVWLAALKRFPKAASIRQALQQLPALEQLPASSPAPVNVSEPGAKAPRTPHFLLAITGYNVAPFLPDLLRSLARQTWQSWQAVFVDDASTDGTSAALRALLDEHRLASRFKLVANSERRYKARNVFDAVQSHPDADDIVAIIDGDDHLAVDHALARLESEFQAGWDVVWSNWRGSDGSRGTSGHLNPFLSPRRQNFLSSHLFSFRRRLFDAVTAADLQDDDGQWFRAGADVALALPILDQTIKRKHIEDVLYVYNRGNPLSHDHLEPPPQPYVTASQLSTSQILRRRRPKPLVVDNHFLHARLYELLQAAMHHLTAAVRREFAAARPSENGT
jgi:glycosyltransferase involved in cell wall biosynthesis